MRLALAALTLLAASAPALAAPVETTPAARELEKQFVLPADGPYLIKLTNVRGRIVVKRWNKNVVAVRATVRAGRALGAAELAYFKAATLEGAAAADGAEVHTAFPGLSSTYPAVIAANAPNVLVEYMVAVPPETAVEARQEYGPIIAAGLDGRVDLFTRDGDVTVSDGKGWVDAGNERGKVSILRVAGDAVGRSLHGEVRFNGVTGDVRALTTTGAVRVDVPSRWVGEVSYHTVSGAFRSDLASFDTDMEPGDSGYVGVMRGPLANLKDQPTVRIRVDTASGDAVLASERNRAR